MIGVTSCSKPPKEVVHCDIFQDPNNYFTIQNNSDSPDRAFNVFCRKVDVFGVKLYATPGVSDVKLLHAANVMAQYLDNNEDGIIDNQAVLNKMLEQNAYMCLFDKEKSKAQRQHQRNIPEGYNGQDLYATEIHENIGEGFDATLEEVLHLITHTGYANVYPNNFGEGKGSEIANAMDIARGGYFEKIPKPYPSEAWYTYDDKTCDYSSMITEYHYWALTSILGAQINRTDIQQEWKLNTKELVQTTDPKVYNLLTDPVYAFATVLPNGKYKQ